jgi:sigma-54 dependent transcriptional regulator, acetoin dehydrogenase operon transcriptional activator AcoR
MMINPYVSIFSTQNLTEKTNELTTLWELFVTNSFSANLSVQMRQNVLDSWNRCLTAGVNPTQLQTNSALAEADLKQILKESELYQVAKPIIDDFFAKLSGTGYLATLTDQIGRILYLKGDHQVLSEAEKMNFSLGMDWSEQAAGTNAIGTSIATGTPIQIFSAEHFCQGCHPWTCSSAPITHPFTKEIIGAIDFTGLRGSAQPHTLGIAISIAHVIEKQLNQIYFKFHQYLTESFFKAINRWKTEQILILNPSFFVVQKSERLVNAFSLSEGTNLLDHSDFLPLKKEFIKLSTSPNYHFTNKNIAINAFNIVMIERIFLMGRIAGYILIFHEQKKKILSSPFTFSNDGPWNQVIGKSEVFLQSLYKCYKAALSNVPILLLGESGTGKEKIAQTIHKASPRADKPFIAINAGAIPKELIGSELFGYESGTFTGAAKGGKKGKFEEADGGTLFLDEIGEMPLDLQVHLLRVLQEKEVTRLGGSKAISVNTRIIAATNKNLYNLCKQGLFREDLFFRLNVVTVNIPRLHERKEDLPLLTDYFLKQFAKKYEKDALSVSNDALSYFLEYSWPGNIRELQNVLEHAVIFSAFSKIELADLPSYLLENSSNISSEPPALPLLAAEERKVLVRLLEETRGNLSAVAKKMNIARSTLYRKLKKYQLS